MTDLDAVVVGAGPNGLAAAVVLARAGLSVAVFEREPTIGGGARTEQLTLPGYLHDVCSAVHPMALASPFFREFGLADRIDLRVPEVSYAHPIDRDRAGLAFRELARTVESLGVDGAAWRRMFAPLIEDVDGISRVSGTSLLKGVRNPISLTRLGLRALEQGGPLWNARFRAETAPAMLAGVFAHANRGLPSFSAAAAGTVLAVHAHARGWPIPIGGSQAIVDALAADVIAHGGQIHTGIDVTGLDELPSSRVVLLDVSARALLRIAGERVPDRYRRRLAAVRYGNAVAKVDYALDGPVPWANPELAAAGTLHLGGTRDHIAAAENEVARGRTPATPYVLVSQPSTVDSTRAPTGHAVLWAYTHVPSGSTEDREPVITDAIEALAPGFRDRILARSSRTAVEVEAHNPNYVGGDISAGEVSLAGLLARPTIVDPWRTPIAGVYLASAAAAPGPGVHGMGGYHAARRALAADFGITELPSLRP